MHACAPTWVRPWKEIVITFDCIEMGYTPNLKNSIFIYLKMLTMGLSFYVRNHLSERGLQHAQKFGFCDKTGYISSANKFHF